MKAATELLSGEIIDIDISIHAAREGGDKSSTHCLLPARPFHSTPPVKAATTMPSISSGNDLFQSTPPVKAATSKLHMYNRVQLSFQSTPPVKAATTAREAQ